MTVILFQNYYANIFKKSFSDDNKIIFNDALAIIFMIDKSTNNHQRMCQFSDNAIAMLFCGLLLHLYLYFL